MFERTFVCFTKYSAPVAKFIIFERRGETCSKIEKNWFLSVTALQKKSKTN